MGVKSLTGLPENFPHCYDLRRRPSTIKPLRSQWPVWVLPTCEGLSWLRSGKVWEIKTLLNFIKTLCSDFHKALWAELLIKTKQPTVFEGKSIHIDTNRRQNDSSLQLLFEHKMNDFNNTEVFCGVQLGSSIDSSCMIDNPLHPHIFISKLSRHVLELFAIAS